MSPARHPPPNRLLAALPEKDRRRLVASCVRVDLAFADILSEPGALIEHVYFPLDSFISLVAPIDGHPGLEVGMIGNEGMLGSTLALSVDVSPMHALVQGAGRALRMSAESFQHEFENVGAMQILLGRYLYVLMSQLAQTAACTRFHVVEARLARWLLMTQDRAQADEFYLTHEFLGHMLGVRRVGITTAATALQKRDLISYNRGNITVLDRIGLENASCGCYMVDRGNYDRILG